jgi:hypothetical protein
MAAQMEIQAIVKDKVNPHFKNNYADINSILAEVKPALHKQGLFIVQPIEEGKVITRIIDAESGSVLCESAMELSGQGNPQQRGSEITYYRRYTLQSLLALEAEDDDAQAASIPVKQDDDKPWLNDKHQRWEAAVTYVQTNGPSSVPTAIATLERDFRINKAMRAALLTVAKGVANVQ